MVLTLCVVVAERKRWTESGGRLLDGSIGTSTVEDVSDIAAIAGVDSRIAAIRSRIGSLTGQSTRAADPLANDLTMDIGDPTDPRAGFDAFGSVYQNALVAAGITAGGSDPGTGADMGGEISSAGTTGTTGFTSASTLGASMGIESLGSSGSPSAYSAYDAGSAGFGGSDGASLLGGAVRVGYGGTSMIATGSGWMPLPGNGTSGYSGVSGSGRSAGQVGGYGDMPVPAELAVYGNGRIPPDALQTIGQGGHRLYAPAAQQWQRMVDAAAADGVTMRVTDSYRSYDQQVELAGRKGLYKDGGFAATPGTSNHGWGLAVDLDTDQGGALAWMQQHGHEYGFVEAVPREPWHWEFRPMQA